MPQIKRVFIDTQVFDRYQYDFGSRDLCKLVALALEGCVHLLLTRVTKREIECHIEEKANEAHAKLKELRRKAPILKNLRRFQLLFEDHDCADIRNQLLQRFTGFCEDHGVEILPLNNVDVDDIVDDFFDRKPPFGEGKKKNEFPDAIAFRTLEDLAEQLKTQIYVVTGDQDWANVCESSDCLSYLHHIPELLALFPDPDLAAELKDALETQNDDLINATIKAFQWLGFVGIQPEVDAIQDISDIHIEFGDMFVIDADAGAATIEVEYSIKFQATASIDCAYPWEESNDQVVESACNGLLTVNVSYQEEDPSRLNIDKVGFDHRDIEVDCSNVIE